MDKRIIHEPEMWGDKQASDTVMWKWLDDQAEPRDIHHYRGKCVRAFLVDHFDFRVGIDKCTEETLKTLQAIHSIWWRVRHQPERKWHGVA